MSDQRIGKLVARVGAEDLQSLEDELRRAQSRTPPAGDVQLKSLDTKLEGLREAQAQLKDLSIELAPSLDPMPLPELYAEKKLEVPPEVRVLSRNADFYVVKLVCKLYVTKGAHVKDLQLNFVLDTRTQTGRRAIAYSIFPETQYRKLAGATLAFGLNGKLGFDIPLRPNGLPYLKAGDVSAHLARASGSDGTQDHLGSGPHERDRLGLPEEGHQDNACADGLRTLAGVNRNA